MHVLLIKSLTLKTQLMCFIKTDFWLDSSLNMISHFSNQALPILKQWEKHRKK